jgi:hypothetical protein
LLLQHKIIIHIKKADTIGGAYFINTAIIYATVGVFFSPTACTTDTAKSIVDFANAQ